MIIRVRITNRPRDKPLEIEIDETSSVEFVVVMIASMIGFPAENITLSVHGRVLNPDVRICDLDLRKIVCFQADLASNADSALPRLYEPRAQARIMSQIQRERVEENFQYAYEHNPEDFVPCSLLFITCKINNHPQIALIDTGAQTSILPKAVAVNCEVAYLIDRRWRAVAVGVGSQRSEGRIHALQVQVGKKVWANPFIVLDGPITTCLLGLDWLKKNRAVVDLGRNCLVIGDITAPFLDHAPGFE
jgi:DNA damage-inducible protein 1